MEPRRRHKASFSRTGGLPPGQFVLVKITWSVEPQEPAARRDSLFVVADVGLGLSFRRGEAFEAFE